MGASTNVAPSRPLPASALWHGLGLFGESYLLFSVGTLRPVWEALYPACFDEDDLSVCANPYRSYKSIAYSVVVGVMAGMVAVGALANDIGRRRGSILTAALMAAGAICLTMASVVLANAPSALFPVMSLCLFVFGIGVGGEYPLSASAAAERAMGALRQRQILEAEAGRATTASAGSARIATHDNRRQSGGEGGKNESLLGSTAPMATATPWQTLDSTSTSCKTGSANNKTPSLGAEESYGDAPSSPATASNETNNSPATGSVNLRTRGREVLLVFSMQGMGIFANSLILTVLLAIARKRNGANQRESDGDASVDDTAGGVGDASAYYDPSTLLNIWRVTYATGAAVLVYVLVSRIAHLTESEVWAQDRERRAEERMERRTRETNVGFRPPAVEMLEVTASGGHEGAEEVNSGHSKGIRPSETRLLLRHYGVRLFGTSVSWLLWDIAFYGNKLFQSSFLIACVGEDASLVDITGASALNAFVALLGYYAAAAIVDNPACGRLALQQLGFVVTGTLFLLCGFLRDRLPSTWLVIMYMGSSFFGQCGPNCTTFLIPAEVFPTSMRALCHGISACSGKLGALAASILFNFVGERDLFLLSGYASFAASVVTFWTIPETTTLDLYEIDKQWHQVLCDETYEGPAADPEYLSFYERNRNRFRRPRRK